MPRSTSGIPHTLLTRSLGQPRVFLTLYSLDLWVNLRYSSHFTHSISGSTSGIPHTLLTRSLGQPRVFLTLYSLDLWVNLGYFSHFTHSMPRSTLGISHTLLTLYSLNAKVNLGYFLHFTYSMPRSTSGISYTLRIRCQGQPQGFLTLYSLNAKVNLRYSRQHLIGQHVLVLLALAVKLLDVVWEFVQDVLRLLGPSVAGKKICLLIRIRHQTHNLIKSLSSGRS